MVARAHEGDGVMEGPTPDEEAVPQDDAFRNSAAVPPHAHCWYCNAVVAPDAPQVKVVMILQMSVEGPVLGHWLVPACAEHYEERQAADAEAAKQAERPARAAAVNSRLVVARGPVGKV